jgi:hypothetical protein
MAKTKTRKFGLEVLERNNIRITVDCKEQWFLLRSDAHQDNPQSRTDLEMKHLKEAEERNAIVLDFGDLFCAMEGKGDRRGAKNLKPEHTKGCYLDALVNTAADKYEPYAHIWALMGQGNHEYSILQHQETDLLERLTAMLQDRTGHKVQAGGFANWVQIRMGRRVTYKIYAHHGYGGGGPVTQDTIQAQRMASYIEGADCTLSGHCFDDQTELLTPSGWRLGNELSNNDMVATMNKETKNLEWQKINKVFKYDHFKKLLRFETSAMDVAVTHCHGMIWQKRKKDALTYGKASELNGMKEVSVFHAAVDNCEDYKISDQMLKLAAYVVADGSFSEKAVRWHFKKQRKIDGLTAILDSLNIEYSKSIQKTGNTKIAISCLPDGCPVTKDKTFDMHLISMLSDRQAKCVIAAFMETDGTQYKGDCGSGQLYNKNKYVIDFLQAMCVKAGYRSTAVLRSHGGYCINVATKTNASFHAVLNAKEESYNGEVWCVNVDNGTLISRRNGKVTITQNTHDAWAMERQKVLLSHCSNKQTVKELLQLKLPTYKDEFMTEGKGFHHMKGRAPKPLGAWWLKLTHKKSSSANNSDVIVATYERAK